MASESIEVRCLGTFQLLIGDRPVHRWRAGKARNLFQFLLLNRGRIVSRTILNESLWPDAEYLGQSSSLKVAVHMLRRILAEHSDLLAERDGNGGGRAARNPRSSLELVTQENGYLLEAHNVWSDTEAFGTRIEQAKSAHRRGDLEQAQAGYRAALDLYGGDYLPDVRLDWAAAEREWLRGRALFALRYLVRAHLRSADDLAVIDGCHRILGIEPYHEETYRTLIGVHGALGQFAQARRWYELCVRRLWNELRVRPAAATTRTFELAMRGQLVGVRSEYTC
jgi:two-component SAPR family response regulator